MRPGGLLLAPLLALLLGACGEPYRGAPLNGPFQPSAAAESSNDQSNLIEGQQVFDRYCQQCHPGGAGGLAPALNNKPAPAWLLRFQVRNGLGAMPAFSRDRIDDAELDALVGYLLVLRDHGSD